MKFYGQAFNDFLKFQKGWDFMIKAKKLVLAMRKLVKKISGENIFSITFYDFFKLEKFHLGVNDKKKRILRFFDLFCGSKIKSLDIFTRLLGMRN